MNAPKFILASASTSRQDMLRAAGVAFETIVPEVDEDETKHALLARGADSSEVAGALAELKAVHVSRRRSGALVLGADQVLDCDGRIYSKAANRDEAKRALQELRGRKHRLISAAVLARDGAALWRSVETAELWMRAVSDGFLEDYLSAEGDNVLSSVGCYRIEGRGVQLFSTIAGDTFVIRGLPLLAVLEALRQYRVLAQ